MAMMMSSGAPRQRSGAPRRASEQARRSSARRVLCAISWCATLVVAHGFLGVPSGSPPLRPVAPRPAPSDVTCFGEVHSSSWLADLDESPDNEDRRDPPQTPEEAEERRRNDMANANVVPWLAASHAKVDNRYQAVLALARKARQRSELRQLSSSTDEDEDVKPILLQLKADYDAYVAENRAAAAAGDAEAAAALHRLRLRPGGLASSDDVAVPDTAADPGDDTQVSVRRTFSVDPGTDG